MSKRTYYRRYRRTYPKQKWQINTVNSSVNFTPAFAFAAQGYISKHAVICQTHVPTTAAAGGLVSPNNVIKTGNFKVKGSFEETINTEVTPYVNAIVYVIFVPQGIAPDNVLTSTDQLATSIFYSHPEWVLGWTRIDLNNQGSDNFSITSRLKRNLNSGDSIQFGVLLINESAQGAQFSARFRATIQYTARAN